MRLFVRGRSLGIQARLTVLAVATALPLVALASFAILRMVDDQRTQIKQDVEHRVENLLWDVDRQIGAIQAELQVLGDTARTWSSAWIAPIWRSTSHRRFSTRCSTSCLICVRWSSTMRRMAKLASATSGSAVATASTVSRA